MCQLQYVRTVGENKVISPEAKEIFLQMMSDGASLNKDASGAFIVSEKDPRLVKSIDLEPVLKAVNKAKDPYEIIGHNRLTTQGPAAKVENNHPFQIGGLVWIHNGIIYNDDTLKRNEELPDNGIETDSYVIGQLVNKYLEEGKKIEDAIKMAAEKLEGSFSVLMWHEGRTFYFKGKQNSFHFGLISVNGEYYVMGSTSEGNIRPTRRAFQFGFPVNSKHFIKKSMVEAVSENIYEISDKGVRKLASFTEKVRTYTQPVNNANSEYNDDGWLRNRQSAWPHNHNNGHTQTKIAPPTVNNKKKESPIPIGKLTKQQKRWFRDERKWVEAVLETHIGSDLNSEQIDRIEEYVDVLLIRINWIEAKQPKNEFLKELKEEFDNIQKALSGYWEVNAENLTEEDFSLK